MKKCVVSLIFLLIGTLFSTGLLADSRIGIGSRVATFIGIGSSGLSSSVNAITFPIKIDKSMLIEPEFIYINSEHENSSGDVSKDKAQDLSIGIFKYIGAQTTINT